MKRPKHRKIDIDTAVKLSSLTEEDINTAYREIEEHLNKSLSHLDEKERKLTIRRKQRDWKRVEMQRRSDGYDLMKDKYLAMKTQHDTLEKQVARLNHPDFEEAWCGGMHGPEPDFKSWRKRKLRGEG